MLSEFKMQDFFATFLILQSLQYYKTFSQTTVFTAYLILDSGIFVKQTFLCKSVYAFKPVLTSFVNHTLNNFLFSQPQVNPSI